MILQLQRKWAIVNYINKTIWSHSLSCISASQRQNFCDLCLWEIRGKRTLIILSITSGASYASYDILHFSNWNKKKKPCKGNHLALLLQYKKGEDFQTPFQCHVCNTLTLIREKSRYKRHKVFWQMSSNFSVKGFVHILLVNEVMSRHWNMFIQSRPLKFFFFMCIIVK